MAMSSDTDNLSREIIYYYERHAQKPETYRKKAQVKEFISIVVRSFWGPGYSCIMIGSTETGFGKDSSDLDLCIVGDSPFELEDGGSVSSQSKTRDLQHRRHSINCLRTLSKRLQREPDFRDVELIEARVPLLKVKHKSFNFEIDITFDRAGGVRNTHLLKSYKSVSNLRLAQLVFVLKSWAQHNGIADPREGLSSYALTLMVIHYLQYGLTPPVLPCLQERFPLHFSRAKNVKGLYDSVLTHSSSDNNGNNLGDLFVGFFRYYSSFDFTNVISVRSGKVFPGASLKATDPHQWRYVCIEEPFDKSNVSRSVSNTTAFQKITRAFSNDYWRLNLYRRLESVMDVRY